MLPEGRGENRPGRRECPGCPRSGAQTSTRAKEECGVPSGAECSAPSTERRGQGARLGQCPPARKAGRAGSPKKGPRKLPVPSTPAGRPGPGGGGCCGFISAVVAEARETLRQGSGEGGEHDSERGCGSEGRTRGGAHALRRGRGRNLGPRPGRRDCPPDCGNPALPCQPEGEGATLLPAPTLTM